MLANVAAPISPVVYILHVFCFVRTQSPDFNLHRRLYYFTYFADCMAALLCEKQHVIAVCICDLTQLLRVRIWVY